MTALGGPFSPLPGARAEFPLGPRKIVAGGSKTPLFFPFHPMECELPSTLNCTLESIICVQAATHVQLSQCEIPDQRGRGAATRPGSGKRNCLRGTLELRQIHRYQHSHSAYRSGASEPHTRAHTADQFLRAGPRTPLG